MNNSNCIYCVDKNEFNYIEDVGEYICEYFSKSKLIIEELYILNYQKNDNTNKSIKINPSLSIMINNNKYYLLNSNSGKNKDFYNNYIKNINSIDELKNLSENKKFKFFVVKKFKIVFLIKERNKDFIDDDLINYFSGEVYKCKKNSLNNYNDSNKKTRKVIRDIRIDQIFSHSKNNTLYNIVRYLKTNYNAFINDTYICKYDFNSENWEIIDENNETLDKSHEYSILVNNESKKNFYKKQKNFYQRVSLSGKIKKKYYLLVPFVKDYDTAYFKYSFLIISNNPLKKFICTNILSIINEYYNNYIENEKLGLLHSLQRKIIDLTLKENLKIKNKDEVLYQFVIETFTSIVSITNAYSATLRFYNPFNESLDLFVDKNNIDGKRLKEIDANKTIFINEKNSINVKVFKNINRNRKNYLLNKLDFNENFTNFISQKSKQANFIIEFFSQSLKKRIKYKDIKLSDLADEINSRIINNSDFYKILKCTKHRNNSFINKLIKKNNKTKEDVQKINRLIIDKLLHGYISPSDTFIYEPNIAKKKNVYLKFRKNTMSEICYPLYYKDIKIGVVNFESPIINAFDEEMDDKKCFLFFIKHIIEEYIRILRESNDISWLSRFIHYENNSHELKQIIESLDQIPKNIKKEMIRLSLNSEYKYEKKITNSKNNKVYLSEIYKIKTNYFNLIKSELKSVGTPEDIINNIIKGYLNSILVTIDYGKNILINFNTMENISIIFQNLIINFTKFCNYEKDTLKVYYIPGSRMLYFRLNTESYFPKEYNNYYFEFPYKSLNSKVYHSGMFIIGVLVRQLSGYININKNDDGYIDSLIIRIPI